MTSFIRTVESKTGSPAFLKFPGVELHDVCEELRLVLLKCVKGDNWVIATVTDVLKTLIMQCIPTVTRLK